MLLDCFDLRALQGMGVQVMAQIRITTQDEVVGVQRWMALDLWVALGMDSQAFDRYVDAMGWSNTWSSLLGRVREIRPVSLGGLEEPGGCA